MQQTTLKILKFRILIRILFIFAPEMKQIIIKNVPNGYEMNVGSVGYFYFTLQELVEGFLYHVALGAVPFIDTKTISKILQACIQWNGNTDIVHEVLKRDERIKHLENVIRKERKMNEKLRSKLGMKKSDIEDDEE